MITDLGTVSAQIIARVRATEGNGLRTFVTDNPRVWNRTSGAHVWDAEGRQYTDMDSASSVATVGHCHQKVTEAIVRQAPLMTHVPSGVPSVARAEFYESLLGIAPNGLDRVLPAINGALANETAIQLARAYTGRRAVVTFSGTYLGRSVSAVAKAGKRAYREQLTVAGDAYFAPYPDSFRSPWPPGVDTGHAVLGLLRHWFLDPASGVDLPACIILEPVQGNGGVVEAPPGFLQGLRDLCDEYEIVLIFDEIQCGFGRTGHVWASEREGVVPDLMSVGKGIGGGLGTAAVLGRRELMALWKPDAVTSTFLVNALHCVAATAAIEVFKHERLADRSAELGARAKGRLTTALKGHPNVGDVRGRGLLIGIEIVTDRHSNDPEGALATAIAREIASRGVLVGRSGRFANVLKVCPPLVIEDEDLDNGLDIIIDVLNANQMEK